MQPRSHHLASEQSNWGCLKPWVDLFWLPDEVHIVTDEGTRCLMSWARNGDLRGVISSGWL